MDDSKQFIEQRLLKKQEEMEWIEEGEMALVGYVVRRTKRTYRRLARITAQEQQRDTSPEPPKELLDLRLSINKLKNITGYSQVKQNWLRQGWLVNKVVFSEDGRTPINEGYLMGPALFKFIEQEKLQKIRMQEKLFKDYQTKLSKCLVPKEASSLIKYMEHLTTIDYGLLKESKYFHNWPISKRMHFLSFIIAILTLRANKSTFDFKEIGAAYFKEIGGSKVFDRQRDDFIKLLEEWLCTSIQALGLVSHGHITAVYFSGSASGEYAQYDYGSLHAVTDVALLKDRFKTSSHVIWLVENRAILTRMAASQDFLKETNSLVICVDGQIRSAHRQFIVQICSSPAVKQVIIWTDYDESGLAIAQNSFQLIANKAFVKFVARDEQIYTDCTAYSNWLQAQLKTTRREQEEVLGDEHVWTKWINH